MVVFFYWGYGIRSISGDMQREKESAKSKKCVILLIMKKETLKELGKYFLDISKILLALTLIAPFMKNGNISVIAIFLILVLFGVGVILTNKGAKDE